MDYRWKSWVVVVLSWVATCAFAGPTGERDGSEAKPDTFASASVTSLFNVANKVDSSGSLQIASSSTSASPSASVPVVASAGNPQGAETGKEEKPKEGGENKVSVVTGTLGSGLSNGQGEEAITVREAIGAQAEAAATKPESAFSNLGNAEKLTDLLTPVSNGSFLKGSQAKSSLAAAATPNGKEKNAASGKEIKDGKTGERGNEKGSDKGDKDAVQGLDPNSARTTFGGDSGDFLSSLSTPSSSSGDSDDDSGRSKAKDQKKEEKETSKEKAEREEKVREALSEPLTAEKYSSMADQIEKNKDAVQRIVESDPEHRRRTMSLVDQFAPSDKKNSRKKEAIFFRNYLERQSDKPGLLGDTGSGISVRPSIHNP